MINHGSMVHGIAKCKNRFAHSKIAIPSQSDVPTNPEKWSKIHIGKSYWQKPSILDLKGPNLGLKTLIKTIFIYH